MSAPAFLVDAALVDPGVRTVTISGAEGRHAARVRRVQIGESIQLLNGHGTVATADVARVGRDEVECTIRSILTEGEPTPRLVVIQALPKGDRGELAVEMMTEVGLDVIVPWAATRSVARWRDERGTKALARWRTTAREAAKQSRRAWLPEVTELATTGDVAARLAAATVSIVLHEGGPSRLTDVTMPSDGEIVLVVGPEGGITDEELTTFAIAGASVCRLGKSLLRTSTAGVVAAGIVLAGSPRW